MASMSFHCAVLETIIFIEKRKNSGCNNNFYFRIANRTTYHLLDKS